MSYTTLIDKYSTISRFFLQINICTNMCDIIFYDIYDITTKRVFTALQYTLKYIICMCLPMNTYDNIISI